MSFIYISLISAWSSSRSRFAFSSDEERPHFITIFRPLSRSPITSFCELFTKFLSRQIYPHQLNKLLHYELFTSYIPLPTTLRPYWGTISPRVFIHHHLSCLEAIAQQSNQSRKNWNENKSWSNIRSLRMLGRRVR